MSHWQIIIKLPPNQFSINLLIKRKCILKILFSPWERSISRRWRSHFNRQFNLTIQKRIRRCVRHEIWAYFIAGLTRSLGKSTKCIVLFMISICFGHNCIGFDLSSPIYFLFLLRIGRKQTANILKIVVTYIYAYSQHAVRLALSLKYIFRLVLCFFLFVFFFFC